MHASLSEAEVVSLTLVYFALSYRGFLLDISFGIFHVVVAELLWL